MTSPQAPARRIIRKGAMHPRARLSPSDVIEMRRLYDNQTEDKPVYHYQLARRFGVSTAQAQRVCSRRQWRDTP